MRHITLLVVLFAVGIYIAVLADEPDTATIQAALDKCSQRYGTPNNMTELKYGNTERILSLNTYNTNDTSADDAEMQAAIDKCSEQYGTVDSLEQLRYNYTYLITTADTSDPNETCGFTCTSQALGLSDSSGKTLPEKIKAFAEQYPSDCVTPEEQRQCGYDANCPGTDGCSIGKAYMDCFTEKCNEYLSKCSTGSMEDK